MSNSFDADNLASLLEPELLEWLKREDGLSLLTNAWRTGIWALNKAGYFPEKNSGDYRTLKSNVICVAIEIKGSPVGDDDDLPQSQSWTEEDEADEREAAPGPVFKVVFAIGFIDKGDARDLLDRLSVEARGLLLDVMWDEIQNSELRDIHNRTRRLSIKEVWEDLPGEEIGIGDQDHPFPWEYRTCIEKDLRILDRNQDYLDLTGRPFVEIRSITSSNSRALPSKLPGQQSATTRAFEGMASTRCEEKLAMFLLLENLLVSLEPSLLIPQQIDQPRRTPDLMVIHRGRVLMIEIDSCHHLVREQKKDKTSQRQKRLEVPNVEKWERDRAFDRYMLCNGVPVLRVWHTDVKDRPHEILSQVMQVLDSVHGS